MAIKFDELLEALDPSLDKFDEDLDSMWIIIPTERRYDELTPSDYFKFAKQYGIFNNQKDCFDKIEELAPNRWDAFIPMKLEGVNESLNEDWDKEEFPDEAFVIVVTTYYNDHGTRKAETESFGPYSKEEAKEVSKSIVGDEVKILKLN